MRQQHYVTFDSLNQQPNGGHAAWNFYPVEIADFSTKPYSKHLQ